MTNIFIKRTTAAILAASMGTAAAAGNMETKAETEVEAGTSGALDTAQNTASEVGDAVNDTADTMQNEASEMAEGMGNGANANAEVNYGTVVSDLNSGTTAGASAEIEGLGEEVTVDTILLSEIEGDDAGNALDNAINAQADAMVGFHDAIEANSDLTAALDAEGYTAEDVVGFQSEGEGEVTLVIDDRV